MAAFPFLSPYEQGRQDARLTMLNDRDYYNSGLVFKTEYDQGWQDYLDQWDREHAEA
jgi:hypothetical protein